METPQINEEELQELFANYRKYLEGRFGLTGVTVMDKLLREAGFVKSDGRLNWDGFIRLAAERGIRRTPSRLPLGTSTSGAPSTRIGPRGGRYTEAITREGRPYRRYF